MNIGDEVPMSNSFEALRPATNGSRRRRRRNRSRASSQAGSVVSAHSSMSSQEALARKATHALQKDAAKSSEGWTVVAHNSRKTVSETVSKENQSCDMDRAGKMKEKRNGEGVGQHLIVASDQRSKPRPAHDFAPTEEQELLIKELEDAADKWPVSTPEGLHQIMLWIQMLRTSNDDSYMDGPGFFQVFVRSRVLEILIRNILEQDVELNMETRQEMLRLFDICLLGSSEDHEWLYRTLRTVRTTTRNCCHKEKITDLVLSVIQSLKRHDLSIAGGSAPQSNVDWRKEGMISSEGRETLETLHSQARNLEKALNALSFKSGLFSRQNEAETGIVRSWRHAFQIITKQIDALASSTEGEAKLSMKRKLQLEHQLEKRTASQMPEINRLGTSVDQLTGQISMLKDKKKQLLEELEYVEMALTEADTHLQTDQQLLHNHRELIDKENADLKNQLHDAILEVRKAQEGKAAVEFAMAFARGMNHRLSPGADAFVMTGEDFKQEYITCLERFWSVERRYIDFLDNRIKYCQRRMLASTEEIRQFESLGIKRTAMSGLEEQMKAAIETDQRCVREAIETVERHLTMALPLVTPQTVPLFQSLVRQLQDPSINPHLSAEGFLQHYRDMGGSCPNVDATKPSESFGSSCLVALSDFGSAISSSVDEDDISFASTSSATLPLETDAPMDECRSSNTNLPKLVVTQRSSAAPRSAEAMSLPSHSYCSVTAASRPSANRRLKPPLRRSRPPVEAAVR